ncbi:MAG: hypothetical protein LC768_06795 [Acidobacteria bacterium]|nr:hypothetical protein [Acidobacteriota bacterium]MCA1638031.1 hypothetical protein [Acidobacteriota bacterium]
MKKINETKPKKKSVPGAIQNTLGINHFESIDGNTKRLSVFNYAENVPNLQCQICYPHLTKESGKALKLCPNCTAKGENLGEQLFEHLKKTRKVIRLQRCFACNKCYAPAKFSQYFGICKECLCKRDDPAPARRRFASRALNNINNILREALSI